jgi:hypothetical protein
VRRDVFEDVIDEHAAIRSLQMFLDGNETFVAAALMQLGCGHVRPTNLRCEPGDRLHCHLCGPQLVERIDLIDPTVFPHPDARVPDAPELTL